MDLILRESMSKFNIYATGRRFCKSFQATLDLQHRQDLLYMACYMFPSDKLSVWAESSSVFYELMTDKVMDLLFGRAAFGEASKYFRYLHFSSENPEGFSKHSLKLSFDLPQKEQMQDFTKVLTAVLHLIDMVGSHQLSPEGKEKAMKRRERVAASEHKSSATERAEAQQLKRQEKQQEQMEKVKRMAPEQRAKFEARQERVQTKRAMKQRMIRA
ncbi:hypothetical protein WJX82_007043 [Trebouxia sp. C0006]